MGARRMDMSEEQLLTGDVSGVGPIHGHCAQRLELKKVVLSGRVHHGWIFEGPRGVGKFRLARSFAELLLAQGQASERSHGGDAHPDLRIIQRPIDDKGKQKAEIPVELIRKDVVDFFSLRPAMGGWRVAIIDSIGELNRFSANALLKTLEEPPPQSAIILISHGDRAVLPTLRSRCRKLRFDRLDTGDALLVLKAAGLSEAQARAAEALAPGQPGRAILFADDHVQQATRRVRSACETTGGLSARDLTGVLNAGAKSEAAFEACTSSILNYVMDKARSELSTQDVGRWAELYLFLCNHFADNQSLNMDRSQSIATALSRLHKTQRGV